MFQVVVMPLSEYLAGEDDDFEMGLEVVQAFQESLSEEVGRQVVWDEEPSEGDLGDSVDEDSLWALRVVAAWLELKGTLDGCEPGDEPWNHSILEEIDEAGGAKQFQQVLHTEVDALCYAPVELPDVYFIGPPEEEDDVVPADAEDSDEEIEVIGIGSLPALVDELEALREPLGLPEALEDIAVEEFVDDPDMPLSGAKFAWFVLRDCAREAMEVQGPLMVLWGELVEEDEE